MDWFDIAMEELEVQLAHGVITSEEYREQLAELRDAAREEEYRQDMRDAGRGHLLR